MSFLSLAWLTFTSNLTAIFSLEENTSLFFPLFDSRFAAHFKQYKRLLRNNN